MQYEMLYAGARFVITGHSYRTFEVPDGLRVLIRRSKTDQTGGQGAATSYARSLASA